MAPLPLPDQIRSLIGVPDDVHLDGNLNNPILERYGENALKGMCRSHPDIVQRHHPDLMHFVDLAKGAQAYGAAPSTLLPSQ